MHPIHFDLLKPLRNSTTVFSMPVSVSSSRYLLLQ